MKASLKESIRSILLDESISFKNDVKSLRTIQNAMERYYKGKIDFYDVGYAEKIEPDSKETHFIFVFKTPSDSVFYKNLDDVTDSVKEALVNKVHLFDSDGAQVVIKDMRINKNRKFNFTPKRSDGAKVSVMFDARIKHFDHDKNL